MLQVKVNRRNYNSFVIIYITWLRKSFYIFTMYIFTKLIDIITIPTLLQLEVVEI